MMQEKKLNFFTRLWIALARPGQYGRLVEEKNGKMIGFVFLFSLLYTFYFMCTVFWTLYVHNGGIKPMIQEEVPDFYFEGSELHLEDRYVYEYPPVFFCADTSVEQYDLSDLEYILNTNKYNQIFLISKKNVITHNDNGQIAQLQFADFNLGNATKDELVDLGLGYLKFILIVFGIMAFPVFALFHFIVAFLLMIVGILLSVILRKTLKSGQIYKISIYAFSVIRVVQVIFNTFLYFVPSDVRNIVYIPLGIVYLLIGIFSTEAYEAEKRQHIFQNAENPYNGNGYYQNTSMPMGNTFDDKFSSVPIDLEPSLGSGKPGSQNGTSTTVRSFGMDTANTYEAKSGDNQGFHPEMPSYGMNMIGLDGTLREVSEKKIVSEDVEAKNDVQAEESYISSHKGLDTNVISFDSTEPVQTYPPVPKEEMVDLFGVSCKKADLDLVDKYLLVGLKDSAVDTLCQIADCTREKAEEILANWDECYHK